MLFLRSHGLRDRTGKKAISCFIWSACLALALAPVDTACSTTVGWQDVHASVKSIEKDVAAFLSLRDALARDLQVPDDRKNGCLVLTIQGAVDGEDLVVYLLRRNDTWSDLRAKTDAPQPYGANADDLTFDGQTLAGCLAIGLSPGQDPARYEIHAKLKAEKPRRVVLKNPRDVAADPGPFSATLKWVGVTRPAFKVKKTKLPLSSTLMDAGLVSARTAGEAYNDIRAMAIQKEFGIPFGLIRPQLTLYRPVWPDPLGAEATGAKKVPDLDLPDLDLADDDGLGFGDDADTETRKSGNYEAALVELRGMRAHIEALSATVQAYERSKESGAALSEKRCEDPDFDSPTWSRPLPRDASGVFQLPDSFDEAGEIRWMHVPLWRCMGPVPHGLWPAYCATLPELVPAMDARYDVDPDLLPWHHAPRSSFAEPTRRVWEYQEAAPRHHLIFLPKACQHKYVMPGAEWSGFYCVAEVESPTDRVLWASVATTYAGALRVNDRLVWRADTIGRDPGPGVKDHLIQLPLRKGRNRLMLLALQAIPYQHTGLALCVSGGPRPREQAERIAAKREAAQAGLSSPYKGSMQWRRHADGQFPDADPVLAWDFDKKTNVRWHTRLRYGAPGSLVVAGDYVLTTGEPNIVICLDRATGKVRWRRRLDYLELKNPGAWEKVQPLFRQLDGLIGNDNKNAKQQKDDIREKLTTIYKDALMPVPAFERAGDHWFGPAMSTPATDGNLLWVRMADRLACFDLDGNRKWFVNMDAKGGGMQELSSIILTGGRVICQVPAYGEPMEEDAPSLLGGNDTKPRKWMAEEKYPSTSMRNYGWNNGNQFRLKAWDADTGAHLWSSELYACVKFGNNYDGAGIPTPLAKRLTDGTETMDVIVTGAGSVYRADDGKLLIPYCGAGSKCASPLDAGGDACIFSGCDGMGLLQSEFPIRVRFVMESRDRLRAIREYNRGVGAHYGGLVLHAGVMHAVWSKLWTSDPVSGEVLGSLDRIWRKGGREPYQPPVVAGGKLFYTDRGREHGGESANMSVVLAGPHPVVLARNTTPVNEVLNMSPAFDKGDMFVRFRSGVACLARMGIEGERYEAEIVARTVLAGLRTAPLDAREPLRIPRGNPETEAIALNAGEVIWNWSVRGPLPAAEADAAAKAMGLPAAPVRGTEVRTMVSNALAGDKSNPYTDLPFGRRIDLEWNHVSKAGTVVLWSAHLKNDRERILRLDEPNAAARLWINGVEVRHGQRVLLRRGGYHVAMRTTFGGGHEPLVRPRFWLSNDVNNEREQAEAELRRVRPYLERAARLLPDTKTGKRAGMQPTRWETKQTGGSE